MGQTPQNKKHVVHYAMKNLTAYRVHLGPTGGWNAASLTRSTGGWGSKASNRPSQGGHGCVHVHLSTIQGDTGSSGWRSH